MFTTARFDLKRLLDLERKIATYDATLAAQRDIEPEDSARARRGDGEREAIALASKYELL